MFEYKKLYVDSELYPNHLRAIENAPKMLYYIGNIELIRKPLYAIVGTRRASPYGLWVAREISKKIAGCGIPVVSGMAEGIDSQAHRGCLDAGTPTVAVLGTGIDVPFPKSNTELYYRIAGEGLILSEYGPGVTGHKQNFPARNRIISGLSKAVIVAEGAFKSGSMITAGLALAQNRDVYAVPGNINQPNSTGVNSLIADGAYPIISMDDVLETLGIVGNQIEMAISNANPQELKLMEHIKLNPGITAAEIAQDLYEGISTVLSMLCRLELKGIIRSEGGRYYFT